MKGVRWGIPVQPGARSSTSTPTAESFKCLKIERNRVTPEHVPVFVRQDYFLKDTYFKISYERSPLLGA